MGGTRIYPIRPTARNRGELMPYYPPTGLADLTPLGLGKTIPFGEETDANSSVSYVDNYAVISSIGGGSFANLKTLPLSPPNVPARLLRIATVCHVLNG